MAKPDGRLTHDLDPSDRPPRDACGVFGVWSPGEDVAKLAYYGLHALQHRGQESAGIAVSDGRRIVVHKEMGLVAQVFDEPSLTALRGDIAVAHCRYSTTGSSVWANAQPTFRSTPHVSLALGHNGNLTNTRELTAMLAADAAGGTIAATSDTDVLTELIVGNAQGPGGVEEAAARILPQVRGAYSLVFMDENTLYAARDPQGFRPLVLGRLAAGWVVASETAALDIVGATFVREVQPGELLSLDERGVRSRVFAAAAPKVCLFEYVYSPARHHDRLALLRRYPRRHCLDVRCGSPRRRGPGDPGAGVRDARGDRIRGGQRHPVRSGAGEELLRGPDLHPAEPDHPAAGHQAEAEPAA